MYRIKKGRLRRQTVKIRSDLLLMDRKGSFECNSQAWPWPKCSHFNFIYFLLQSFVSSNVSCNRRIYILSPSTTVNQFCFSRPTTTRTRQYFMLSLFVLVLIVRYGKNTILGAYPSFTPREYAIRR